MKFVATFDVNGLRLTETFDDEFSAQAWLDSRNNNLEYRTKIDIFDNEGNYVDGYFYTEV